MDEHAPPKPWYRVRNIVLLVLVAAFCLAGREVYRAVTATPGKSVDYGQKLADLAQSLKPGSADQENAAPLMVKMLELRDQAREAVRQTNADVPSAGVDFTLLYTKFNPANPGATGNMYGDEADFNVRRAYTMDMLNKYREVGVFKTLEQIAATRVNVRPKQEGRLIEMLIPELGGSRDMARANAARMRLARETKDAKEFTEAFEQSMGLARACTGDPIIISNLVGIAIAALAASETRDAVAAGEMTPDMLRGVAAALERQGSLTPVAFSFGGERLFVMDIIQATHTDDGNGDGRRIVSEANKLQEWGSGSPSRSSTRLANLAAPFYPSKKQITGVTEDFYSKVNEYAKMTAFQRRSATWNPTNTAVSLPWNYDILKLMLPALDKAIATGDQAESEIAGLHILLAIELHRADHGRLPATLDELTPSYLPHLPRDTYAPDGKFRYRVLPKPDDAGRAYLLYSVGPDGTDDGGADSGAAPGQPIKAVQGTDTIINKRKQ